MTLYEKGKKIFSIVSPTSYPFGRLVALPISRLLLQTKMAANGRHKQSASKIRLTEPKESLR